MIEIVLLRCAFKQEGVARFEERTRAGLRIGEVFLLKVRKAFCFQNCDSAFVLHVSPHRDDREQDEILRSRVDDAVLRSLRADVHDAGVQLFLRSVADGFACAGQDVVEIVSGGLDWMPMEPPGWITVWTIRYRSSLTIRTVISPVPPFMPGMVTAGIAPKSMRIWFSFVFGKGTSRPNEPRDAFSFISRRVWDSNPRDLTSNGFQDDNHYWKIADFNGW